MAERRGATFSRRALDVMGSILTTLLVFGATPAVLLTVVGDPLGNGMGHQWSLVARLLLAALALVAWVAWAVCCTQLARAVVEQVRSGHVGAPAGAALTDKVAARIAAGVFSLLAIWTPLALSTGAGATGPHGAVTVGAVTVEREAPAATPSSPAPSTSPGDPGHGAGHLRRAPGGLPMVHRGGAAGRRRRLAGDRRTEPRSHHARRPPVRRSEQDSRRLDPLDARPARGGHF